MFNLITAATITIINTLRIDLPEGTAQRPSGNDFLILCRIGDSITEKDNINIFCMIITAVLQKGNIIKR